MFKNYLISAFRNLLKRKIYTILNVSGLAIGFASFLLILLYVVDELRYDRHHTNAKNIHRLVNVYDFEGVGENSASSPFPVAFTLLNDFQGEIRNVVRIFNFQAPRSFVEAGDKKFNERGFYFADSTYFNIFDHQFLYGNPETALDEMGSVVITESAAYRYFDRPNAMGETIMFEESVPLTVTAVIRDVPRQSHFRFDFLGSISTLRKTFGGNLPETWVWNPCWTYLLLDANTDPEELEAAFPGFIDKYFYDAEKDNISLYLQPLTDIHLKSKLDYEIAPNNNINSVYILSAIALFLLIIAMINYMNLATATSAGRAREIGIKKVSGSSRFQLIIQFIGESVLLAWMALFLGLILVELALPMFNNITGKTFVFVQLLTFQNVLVVLLLGAVIGILAGLYPAFYLSSFDPLVILKSNMTHSVRSGMARKTLVIVQFTISVSLIIATIIIHNQLQYMRNAELGFTKENILVVPVNRTPVVKKFEEVKKELLQSPYIGSVTAMDDIFGSAHNTHEFRPEGFPEDQWQFYPALVVQYDFLKTFDIPLLAGRDYNETNKTDPAEGILINEAMVRHMGWSSPQEALGKKFRSLQGNEKVIGVFNDFHQTSLHETSGPFVLNMKENPGAIQWFLKYMVIKIREGSDKDALRYIEDKWMEVAPNRPFEYFYLENELAKLYKDEDNLSKLSFAFTLIILFIAALGLLGLSSFMAEQRTREIGVRKVLGATTRDIVKTMTREFVYLVSIASILAWLVSWLVMDDWLNRFPYQARINWIIFIGASALAYAVALGIASLRALLTARMNPSVTLKYE